MKFRIVPARDLSAVRRRFLGAALGILMVLAGWAGPPGLSPAAGAVVVGGLNCDDPEIPLTWKVAVGCPGTGSTGQPLEPQTGTTNDQTPEGPTVINGVDCASEYVMDYVKRNAGCPGYGEGSGPPGASSTGGNAGGVQPPVKPPAQPRVTPSVFEVRGNRFELLGGNGKPLLDLDFVPYKDDDRRIITLKVRVNVPSDVGAMAVWQGGAYGAETWRTEASMFLHAGKEWSFNLTLTNIGRPYNVELKSPDLAAAGLGDPVRLVWFFPSAKGDAPAKDQPAEPGRQGNGVIAITGGWGTGYALRADGTVWAWGYNGEGQAGHERTDQFILNRVSGLPSIRAIAAGGKSAYALDLDGAVWAWGDNAEGQLGQGASRAEGSPGASPWKGKGVCSAWGGPLIGCADAASAEGPRPAVPAEAPPASPVPLRVNGLPKIAAVAAADTSAYALDTDGNVWAWGANSVGELGNGTNTPSRVPVRVLGLPRIKAVAAGFKTAYALDADGNVWSWGFGIGLGDGVLQSRNTPARVPNLTAIRAIAGGGTAGYALDADGRVWNWGLRANWATAPSTAASAKPVPVAGLSGVTAIAATMNSALALEGDGTVWSWGDNSWGQLGNGTTEPSGTPVQVARLSEATTIGAGWKTAYAVKSDGTAWGWGNNEAFELLNYGYGPMSPVPVRLDGIGGKRNESTGSNQPAEPEKPVEPVKPEKPVPPETPVEPVSRGENGEAAVFTDLGGYEWARNAIESLAGRGIMKGVAPGRFNPAGAVTRAQFAALMQRTFQLPPSSQALALSDVPPGHWSYEAVQATLPYMDYYYRIGGGYAFRPDQPFTRQNVAAAMVRLLGRNGRLSLVGEVEAEGILAQVKDADDIAPALRVYVATAVKHKVMMGQPDGRFNPAGIVNRAQAAVLLQRMDDAFLTVGP